MNCCYYDRLASKASLKFLLTFLTVAVSVATDSPCFKDPTRDSCKNADAYYTTEMRRKDLNGLCTAMPEMSGCVVRTECQQGKLQAPCVKTGVYCMTFVLE